MANNLLHFDSIRLQKTSCFADTEFKFEPGLSVIYGLNKTHARSTNGNAAGKSYFFSQLRELLYEEPVVGAKQDAVKSGIRTLKMRLGKNPVVIERNNAKMDITYLQEGKKFTTKGKQAAKEWLAKNQLLTPEEFDTYVYLDSRVPHPLVMGNSTTRRNFLNTFFGLDKLDIEKKLIAAEYEEVKKAKLLFSSTEAEYKMLKESVGDIKELRKKKERLTVVKEELETLTQKNEKLQRVIRLIDFETRYKNQIESLRKLAKGAELTEEWFDETYRAAQKSVKNAKQSVDMASEWESYRRETRNYTKALDELSIRTKKFLASKTDSKKAVDSINARVDELTELETELSYAKQDLKKAKCDRPDKPDTQEPDAKLGELVNDIRVAEHKLEHSERFNKGVCGECGQDVAVVDPAKLRARLSKLRKLRDLAQAWIDYREELKAYAKSKDDTATLTSKIEGLTSRIEKLLPYKAMLKEVRNLPDKPSVFSGERISVDDAKAALSKAESKLRVLEVVKPSLDLICELEKLPDAHRKLAPKAAILHERVNKLNAEASRLNGELEAYRIVKAQLVRLQNKLDDLSKQLVNEAALSLLMEAYSDKAIKKMAIQTICERLMTIINQYAKVVFPEDYHFEFNWDTSQLSFLVYRKYGKSVFSSDVRKLSGAESKLFTVILVLALLTFVPPRKRSNVLILDEPGANMSAETLAAFQEILPVVNKIIPTIIIITPRMEEVYENATAYTVVKRKGLATIVKGHPNEQ